jgi:hypothetical protein
MINFIFIKIDCFNVGFATLTATLLFYSGLGQTVQKLVHTGGVPLVMISTFIYFITLISLDQYIYLFHNIDISFGDDQYIRLVFF